MELSERFEENIVVNAPVELCYEWYRNFELLPGIVHNFKAIRHLKDNTWEWNLVGEHGDVSYWEMFLATDIPNRLISWRTTSGPKLNMRLDINFTKTGNDQTRITAIVSTMSPKSQEGEIIKNLYSVNQRAVSKAMDEFKHLIEDYWGQTISGRYKGRPAWIRDEPKAQRAHPPSW